MNFSSEEHEIVIIGGGICGLATALALHRKGFKSIVLERAGTLRATGAAIGIFTNGWRALDQLGVASLLREGACLITRTRELSMVGKTVRESPLGEHEVRCVRRSDLIETLADGLPAGTIRFNCQVVGVETDPATSFPSIHLSNGAVIHAKVLIGCDGVHSITANLLRLKPTNVSPMVGIRGITNYAEGHGFPNEFVRVFSHQSTFGRIPIDPKNVYWFFGRHHLSTDSVLAGDVNLIRKSTLEGAKGFPEELVDMVDRTELDSLIYTRIRYRAPWDILLGTFRKGTMTVAGDAMHVMGPYLGQGGSAGLEDSIVLARCLAEVMDTSCLDGEGYGDKWRMRIEMALEKYVKQRRMRVLRLSTQSYLTGLAITTSLPLKMLILLGILVFFGRFHHANYDCGRL